MHRAAAGRRPDHLAGPYRPTCAREKARKKETERAAGKTGGSRQKVVQGCAAVAGAGHKIEGARDGFQESSMVQTETGAN